MSCHMPLCGEPVSRPRHSISVAVEPNRGHSLSRSLDCVTSLMHASSHNTRTLVGSQQLPLLFKDEGDRMPCPQETLTPSRSISIAGGDTCLSDREHSSCSNSLDIDALSNYSSNDTDDASAHSSVQALSSKVLYDYGHMQNHCVSDDDDDAVKRVQLQIFDMADADDDDGEDAYEDDATDWLSDDDTGGLLLDAPSFGRLNTHPSESEYADRGHETLAYEYDEDGDHCLLIPTEFRALSLHSCATKPSSPDHCAFALNRFLADINNQTPVEHVHSNVNVNVNAPTCSPAQEKTFDFSVPPDRIRLSEQTCQHLFDLCEYQTDDDDADLDSAMMSFTKKPF